MIRHNQHKYSISVLCHVLQLPRSTYYYEATVKQSEDQLSTIIQDIFHGSRQNNGTRKIKVELKKQGYVVSRRRIARISLTPEHLSELDLRLSTHPALHISSRVCT